MVIAASEIRLGILEFVDQHEPKASRKGLAHSLVLSQQIPGRIEQIVKVE